MTFTVQANRYSKGGNVFSASRSINLNMKRFLTTGLLLFALSGCSTLSIKSTCNSRDAVPNHLSGDLELSCGGDQPSSLVIGDYFAAEARKQGDEEFYRAAAAFYQRAAQTHTGQIHIYVPGAGKVAGYTMPLNTGPATYGLPAAKGRLADLYFRGLGVKQDTKKACKYWKEAGFNSEADFELVTACLRLEDKKTQKKAG